MFMYTGMTRKDKSWGTRTNSNELCRCLRTNWNVAGERGRSMSIWPSFSIIVHSLNSVFVVNFRRPSPTVCSNPRGWCSKKRHWARSKTCWLKTYTSTRKNHRGWPVSPIEYSPTGTQHRLYKTPTRRLNGSLCFMSRFGRSIPLTPSFQFHFTFSCQVK